MVNESGSPGAFINLCPRLSIDNILQFDLLSTPRKEDLVFVLKQPVREGIHTKVYFLQLNRFCLTNNIPVQES